MKGIEKTRRGMATDPNPKKLKAFPARLGVWTLSAILIQGAIALPNPEMAAAQQQQQPNILYIMMDDVGWGDLCKNNPDSRACKYECLPNSACENVYQCVGFNNPQGCILRTTPLTPTLDALADRGVGLKNFYTPSPLSSPARGAFVSGRHPMRTGVMFTGNFLPDGEKTLADFLGDDANGGIYHTAIFGRWDLGWGPEPTPGKPGKNPWNRGFDYSYSLVVGVDRNALGFCLTEKFPGSVPDVSYVVTDYSFVCDKSNTDPNRCISDADCAAGKPGCYPAPGRSHNQLMGYCNPNGSYWCDPSIDKVNGCVIEDACNSATPPDRCCGKTPQLAGCFRATQVDFWESSGNKPPFRQSGTEERSFMGVFTDKAIDYIRNPAKYGNTTGKPFFMYFVPTSVHTPNDIHLPGNPDPKLDRARIVRDKCELTCAQSNSGTQGNPPIYLGQVHQECVSECEIREAFPEAVHEIDTQIKRLLAALDDPDNNPTTADSLTNNTIVIFTSDNGPYMGNSNEYFDRESTGGLRAGKKTVYEGGERVPFIAYWPNGNWKSNAQNGRVLAQPTILMDITATLLARAGYKIEPNGDGTSTVKNSGNVVMGNILDGQDISDVLVLPEINKPQMEKKKDIHLLWGGYASSPICSSYTNNLCNRDPEGYPIAFKFGPPYAILSHEPCAQPCTAPANTNGLKLLLDPFLTPIEFYDLNTDPGETKNLLSGGSGFVSLLADKSFAFYDQFNPVSRFYFPSIKDDNSIRWENYLSVQASRAVSMDVKISVYDMTGALKGTYLYSNSIPTANAPAIAPYARVAQRPCLIASGSSTVCSVPVEGSMIVETNVPAIATTNTIANNFEGFSIYEAAKPRSIHNFPKAYDGPNSYQVYMLAQNIHASPVKVTARLFGKNAASPGHGATRSYTIPAYGTLKIRPSDIAGGIDFSGSVVITSDGPTPGDGLGPAIPALCRYELGKEAMTIYESTVEQPALFFPTMKDGKFGGTTNYQNYLSVVNPGTTDAAVDVILYANNGVKKASTGPVLIPAGGKSTWRPSMILGTLTAPIDFEGAVMVTTSVPVVGQTNTMYPGANIYECDAFDLFESAKPNSTLFFPKAFDNIVADGHLYDNVVYVQNPHASGKNIKIEQFNNNGTLNGVRTVALGPNATYVYRPKDLVADGTGQFRGSVQVTETGGGEITGAIKYDIHQGTTSTTPVDAMTLYRSMGM